MREYKHASSLNELPGRYQTIGTHQRPTGLGEAAADEIEGLRVETLDDAVAAEDNDVDICETQATSSCR